MKRSVASALLLVLALAPASAAHTPAPATPVPFTNNHSNSFGSIYTDPYLPASEASTPLEVRVQLRLDALAAPASFIMVALNLHADYVNVRLDTVRFENGTTVPISRDDRGLDPLQPRVLLAPGNLSQAANGSNVRFVIRGHVEGADRGSFHVGALVIAFASDWSTVTTHARERAELYAFTMFSVTESSRSGAPFVGQGNGGGLALLWWLAVAGTAACALVLARPWWSNRRRGEAGRPRPEDDPGSDQTPPPESPDAAPPDPPASSARTTH